MNKSIKITIVICIILLALILFRYAQEKATPSSQKFAVGQNATILVDTEFAEITENEEAINIAMRGITLTQGESGEKTWLLNATSASFDQDSGTIKINQPRVTYLLKNQKSNLLIKSRVGRLDQAKNQVEMWSEVRVDESNNVLTTSRAIYNAKTHILTLPEALEFFNPEFTGSSNQAQWDLNTNILTANGNVRVTIIGKKK